MLSIIQYSTALLSLTALSCAQQTRPYDCVNQGLTCTNICYWLTCITPTIDTFTRDSGNAALVRQRRKDCGVSHTPRPCTFPGFGVGGDWTDEFPFASTVEGGRTPNGEGASLLCTPAAEPRTQAAWITNHIYGNPNMPQGTQFQLMMTNTAGIEYCDPTATPSGCDGSNFAGFHYFVDDDIYCQWDISTSSGVQCLDGQGNPVNPPTETKRKARGRLEQPRAANFSNLLHVREPELRDKIKAEMLVTVLTEK